MYPARVLSLYNGWDILKNQKSNVWDNILQSLERIYPITIANTKVHQRLTISGTDEKIQLKDLSKIWESLILKEHAFLHEFYYDYAYGQTGNKRDYRRRIIDKVHIRMTATSGGEDSNLSKIIFAEAPKGVREGLTDVTVLLVPENSVMNFFGNKRDINYDFPFSESQCRRQLDSLLPIPYGAPFVIVFFSVYKRSTGISIQELQTVETVSGNEAIERSLEFAPEYTQAGISILSYFSEVLRQKYPNLNVKVRIEQQGTTVLMHVELPSGNIETIKEELATYFLVVAGKEKPDILLSNPYHIMALENKLQIANMELRMSHQLNAQLNHDIEGFKLSQQRMEESFKEQIAEQGTQIRTLISLTTQQAASHERVQLAQIGHTNTLFKDLLTEAQGSQKALMAVRNLESNLLSGIALIDIQEQLTNSLSTIHKEKPSILKHLAGQVESAGFGAVGGFVLDWISKHA